MHARTTRAAAALAAGAMLVVGANALTTSSTAAPGAKTAAVSEVGARAGAVVYRTRPFSSTLLDGAAEYFTVRVPRSGNYQVALRGMAAYDDSTTSFQCLVGDKNRLLANDLRGLYAVNANEPAPAVSINGFNEVIDVDLRKTRPILVACGSYGGDVEVVKPITVTFERNGDFTRLDAKPFTPPPLRGGSGLLGGLGG